MRQFSCAGPVILVLVLAGCSSERRSPPPPAGAPDPGPSAAVDPSTLQATAGPGSGLGGARALRAIPAPDLSRLADSVRSQIGDAYASLQSAIGNPKTPALELSQAYGDMGKIFYAADDLDSAESCLMNAQTLAPDEMRWPYYLGRLFLAKGDPARAAPFLEGALQLRPDHAPTLVWLGDAYLALGRPEAAEPLFQRAVALGPNTAAALHGLGRSALARRDYAQAAEYLERALALDRQASAIHYPLAMAYRGLGDTGKAEAHLRQRGNVEARMRDPLMDEISGLLHSAMAYEIAGRQALVTRDFRAAAEDFRKGVELAADNATLQAELRHKLGTALFLTGDARGGIEQFEKALQRSPEFAPAHYSLGVLMISARQYRQAIDHLSAAVKYEPNDVEAHLRLADALQAAGRPALSLAQYEQALRIDARLGEAQFGGAIALAHLGRFAEARDRLTAGMAAHPDQPAFVNALVRVLAAAPDDRVRDGQRAMDLARRWLDNKPPGEPPGEPLRAERDETVAMALAEVGQYDAAMAKQREAMKSASGVLAERLARNLALYQRRMPSRTPWSEYPLSSDAKVP